MRQLALLLVVALACGALAAASGMQEVKQGGVGLVADQPMYVEDDFGEAEVLRRGMRMGEDDDVKPEEDKSNMQAEERDVKKKLKKLAKKPVFAEKGEDPSTMTVTALIEKETGIKDEIAKAQKKATAKKAMEEKSNKEKGIKPPPPPPPPKKETKEEKKAEKKLKQAAEDVAAAAKSGDKKAVKAAQKEEAKAAVEVAKAGKDAKAGKNAEGKKRKGKRGKGKGKNAEKKEPVQAPGNAPAHEHVKKAHSATAKAENAVQAAEDAVDAAERATSSTAGDDNNAAAAAKAKADPKRPAVFGTGQ